MDIRTSDHRKFVIFIPTPGFWWQNVPSYSFGRKITNREVRYDNSSPVFYQYHKKFPVGSYDFKIRRCIFFLGIIKSKKHFSQKKMICLFVTVHTPFCFGRDDIFFKEDCMELVLNIDIEPSLCCAWQFHRFTGDISPSLKLLMMRWRV